MSPLTIIPAQFRYSRSRRPVYSPVLHVQLHVACTSRLIHRTPTDIHCNRLIATTFFDTFHLCQCALPSRSSSARSVLSALRSSPLRFLHQRPVPGSDFSLPASPIFCENLFRFTEKTNWRAMSSCCPGGYRLTAVSCTLYIVFSSRLRNSISTSLQYLSVTILL